MLSAPASSLLRLSLAKDKTAVLHRPEVTLSGDSAVLLELAAILQDLELDWEYELSHWLGPVASQLLGGHLRRVAMGRPEIGQQAQLIQRKGIRNFQGTAQMADVHGVESTAEQPDAFSHQVRT